MRIHKYVFPVCVVVVLISDLTKCITQIPQFACRQACKDSEVTIEKVTDAYGLSEGPHWDHRTQKLYFVDSYNQCIRRLDPATGVVTNAYIANGFIGVAVPVKGTTDQFLAGVEKDLVLVTWDGNSDKSEVPMTVLCSLDSAQSPTRIDDGKVDSSGRFWLGTMGREVNGKIGLDQGTFYCVDGTLKPEKKESPVSISNGLAWNKEDNTMYYNDSPTRMVAAYDYDPNSGRISNKRIVFDLNQTDLQGMPDGMTIDVDDNLWIAIFDGQVVIQVNPKTGELLRKIKIPVKHVTSVTFGGPLLDILYVTTSSYNVGIQERTDTSGASAVKNLEAYGRVTTPGAGAVFAIKNLGVRGRPANSFVIMN